MQKQQGFSLIELLIVVGIIAALSAIAIPQYQKYQDKAKVTAAIATLTNMRSVVEAEIMEEGVFPENNKKEDLGIPDTVTLNPTKDSVKGNMTLAVEGLPGGGDVKLSRSAKGEWECTQPSTNIEVDGCSSKSGTKKPTP
ncbi:pilin [Salinivibrio sp. AR640]|uniref:pilin n=1 Tax=Salinivibrio sp. AR640 TaxID=1909437 RepID=UPI0009871F91|nr:pilin [Salinivibrio sp. AR640]OOE95050.1 hypothetical protein BZG75_03685 [Salinivibrio sp. AR640]